MAILQETFSLRVTARRRTTVSQSKMSNLCEKSLAGAVGRFKGCRRLRLSNLKPMRIPGFKTIQVTKSVSQRPALTAKIHPACNRPDPSGPIDRTVTGVVGVTVLRPLSGSP